MANEYHEFSLSVREVNYLKDIARRDDVIAKLLRFQTDNRGRTTIRLAREDAEGLRDQLGTQLIMYGFAEDYSPNEDGEMIEALIDKFFIR